MAVTQVSAIYQMVLFLPFLSGICGSCSVMVAAGTATIHGAGADTGAASNTMVATPGN